MRFFQVILNRYSFILSKLDLYIKLECMVNLEEILLFIFPVSSGRCLLFYIIKISQTSEFLEIAYRIWD